MAVNNVVGVRSDISEMLSKLREMSNKPNALNALDKISPPDLTSSVSSAKPFDETLSSVKDVFSKINDIQNHTDQVKNAYISGDKHVSMAQVLLVSEKSKLAFEGLITVRNKILEAYKEIMNMPI